MIFQEFLPVIFRSFTIIFLGTLIFVGIYLIVRAFKVKANNFYSAGIAWLLIALGQTLNQLFNIPVEVYAVFSKLSFILLVYFTWATFYKNYRSKIGLSIIFFSIFTGAISWYFDSLRYISQDFYVTSRIFDFIHGSVALDWLAISCYSAYRKVKIIEIAPWVKMRYKLITITSPILSLVYLILIFHPYTIPFGDLSTLESLITYSLTSILTLIYGISFTISWIIPDWLKRYINRNYDQLEELEITEDELMALIRRELSGED